jgi:hypothetical protein
MPGSEATYGRADRLAVMLTIFGSQHLTADDALAYVDRDDFYAISDVTDEDQELANACLDLEGELQDREWAAVERLLFHGMFGEEEVEASMDELAPAGLIGLIAQDLRDLMALGLL